MQEYELSGVLEQYDIVVNSTRKTRGAILCDTDKGLLILKEVTISESRVPALCELYEHLEGQGYARTDRPIKNQEQNYISQGGDGGKYMLRVWHGGRECDVGKPAELLKATGNLAKLHLLMQKKLGNPVAASPSLQEEYARHNRELKKVRKFMRSFSPKGEFEYAFLKCFDQMYRWADTAINVLQDSGYDALYQKSLKSSHLIHGEYNYHNVLMLQEGSREMVTTTNFDRFKQDVQVEDLYYFLRKVMEKHGWKERLGDNMLNAYSAIKPLTSEEMGYLKNRLIYPEKFWKIANSYYRSNKAWISVKNVEKLNTAIHQTREKEHFLENIFAFHL